MEPILVGKRHQFEIFADDYEKRKIHRNKYVFHILNCGTVQIISIIKTAAPHAQMTYTMTFMRCQMLKYPTPGAHNQNIERKKTLPLISYVFPIKNDGFYWI